MANDKRQGDQRTEGDLQEKLVQVNRVAKTVKAAAS
jgi:small subunit ribosomal protein S5